ncbi:cadherin-like protein 26 [Mastacembelus armatus]|uniref:B-cadherin-like n=1 Tax=Mastacembelus armatus TaxID=205130 RepID=A0A3Q3NNU7_9TELE|nr:B-cadherin-like [Mastacembelus armatus]
MRTVLFSLFIVLCLGVGGSCSKMLLRQKRTWIIDSFSIDEGYKGAFPYTLGTVEVEKNLTFFQLHGHGVDEEPKGILSINEDTGEISVHGPVDHEKYNILRLTFQALDRESHVVDTRLGIEIVIIDSNDNSPKFDQDKYEISKDESTKQGTELITIKATDADISMKYNTFNLQIVEVTPKPHELEFYLTQVPGSQVGTISFKGCLDHEKAEQYAITVEAKDCGKCSKEKRLSSRSTVIINIEDGNNHLPVITGHTGSGRVKEGEENVLVSRLQVTDEDTKGTAAWRAIYQIHGDINNNFRITTDPETNEGLLHLKKHLDYENSPQQNLTIIVENGIPYFSCKMENSISTGLWKVTYNDATADGTKQAQGPSTYQITVTVEDVNEAPIFDQPNKDVRVVENEKPGRHLATFTARDPDAHTFVYIKGEDPAAWVTVDRSTGKITTFKSIDRESSFVKDDIYVVTIYAVDSGVPPMTGTATLNIHITDENDNAPFFTANTINVCQSHGPSRVNITAMDLDKEPYGGPFHFKLRGDVEGQWKVDPVQGYSVELVKENTIYPGHYELLLEVSDLQGKTAVHTLSVTVCTCLDTARPNCLLRKSTSSAAEGGVLGIILMVMLLFAGILLLAFLVTCKKKNLAIPDDGSGQHLMNSNTENPGNDCKVSLDSRKHIATISKATKPLITDSVNVTSQAKAEDFQFQRTSLMEERFSRGNSTRWSMGAPSTSRMRQEHRSSRRRSWAGHSKYIDQGTTVIQHTMLLEVLNKMLYKLQAPGEELCDYAPRVYDEEGDSKSYLELDAISIPDISFDAKMNSNVHFKFSTLASICLPSESMAYSTKSSSSMEKSSKVEGHKIPLHL